MDILLLSGSILGGLVLLYNILIFGVILKGRFGKPPKLQQKNPVPTISVLIPAKDEEEAIAKTLRSIEEAENDYVEKVIVINDGSQDSTEKIASAFNTEIVRTKGVGKVDALNKGLDNVDTDVVFIIDADTIVSEDVFTEAGQYFQDPTVGAISPPIYAEGKNILSWFQRVEYELNDAVRRGLSRIFESDIWFFGAVSAYRTDWVAERGGFKAKTLTEDAEIALDIRKDDYKVLRLEDSYCVTEACKTSKELLSQRIRWFQGGYQLLIQRTKDMFTIPGGKFVTTTHWFWGIYSLLFLPLLIYQVLHWMPDTEILRYIIGYFSLVGPVEVLLNIPQGWLNIYNVFGILTGLSMPILLLTSITKRRNPDHKDVFTLFFYFPYTLYLNLSFSIGIIKAMIQNEGTFKR